LKRRVGFIEQDDITFPELTVRQALMFAARLRIAGTNEERAKRIDTLLAQMHLEGCADVRIGGGMMRGISGGQRKRVCIATELIAQPTFLFCDEPTSGGRSLLNWSNVTPFKISSNCTLCIVRLGLDSETALVIIGVLQGLAADAGMCIITSIHQPSSQVYAQFNDLCFLDGGRCVYFGKAGDVAIDHFSKLAGTVCPSNYNPPDW
jgi:ABC-type multidrug transport system ATPase subunit